jgi:hypothetical protein
VTWRIQRREEAALGGEAGELLLHDATLARSAVMSLLARVGRDGRVDVEAVDRALRLARKSSLTMAPSAFTIVARWSTAQGSWRPGRHSQLRSWR